MSPRPTPVRPAPPPVPAAFLAALLTAACLAGAAPSALAHDEGEAAPAVDLAATLGSDYQRVAGRIVQLAEAFPADKYGWRPAEGVRSVSEAVMHVADANFALAAALGVTPPEGLDLEGQELEQITDRERVLEILETSIDHAERALAAAEGTDLNRTVHVFGFDMPAARVLVILDTHAHEHLGQLIAYARSNGITPPWSRGESE